ncbi:hypothetical protein [Enterobacter quasiroggenkampii]|uniref:hypothetical protein n=1 Tax=Enterobacter quasiroggenkampii TaxID=2497436 RepID=UPI0021D08EC4|nr:hypothetical protein [Enterobacter quasiroggenkampii]MCU6368091.1 hypothetical protein [Enterobacter quasiroggenkampii]
MVDKERNILSGVRNFPASQAPSLHLLKWGNKKAAERQPWLHGVGSIPVTFLCYTTSRAWLPATDSPHKITPQGYIYSSNKCNALFSCTPPVKKGEYASGIDDVYAKTAGMFLLIKAMREVEW